MGSSYPFRLCSSRAAHAETFRGTIQGNVIRGESWNVTGKRWQTHLQRTSP